MRRGCYILQRESLLIRRYGRLQPDFVRLFWTSQNGTDKPRLVYLLDRSLLIRLLLRPQLQVLQDRISSRHLEVLQRLDESINKYCRTKQP